MATTRFDASVYDRLVADRAAMISSLLDAESPHYDPYSGAWFVAGYQDVREFLMDPDLLPRNSENATADLTPEQRVRVKSLERHFSRWLAFSEAPAQKSMRALFRQALRGSAARERTARFRAMASGAQPSGLEGRELVNEYILPYTTSAVLDLFGCDADDGDELVRHGDALIAYLGLDRYREDVVTRAIESLGWIEDYVSKWIGSASGIIPATFQFALGQGVRPADLSAVFSQLLTGSLEPTRTALAHGIDRLCAPGQAAAFKGDPTAYVSEVLRLASPFHFAPRTAGCDVESYGRVIPAGARVNIVLCAANRDPRQFPKPDTLDTGRPIRRHLTFGYGRHFCSGALLAEEIITAGLTEVLEAGLGDTAYRAEPKLLSTPGMTRYEALVLSRARL